MTAPLTPEEKAERAARRQAMRGRISETARAANKIRAAAEHVAPGKRHRVVKMRPSGPHQLTATQRSKIALGDDPHLMTRERAALRLAQRPGAGASLLGAPLAEIGEAWPERGECCWPTSEGRPWRFCRAPTAAGSPSGYCAGHQAATKPGARAGAGAIERADFTLPGFRSHQDNAVRGSRTAAAQIAMRGPRK